MCFGVFSGFSETKRAKSKHIFGNGVQEVGQVVAFCLPWGVPTWAAVQAFGAILLTLAKMDKIPPFVCFPALLVRGVGLEYAFICDFKAVFRGFWGADVYLYGLMPLRGLWGFCVREWLGGFEACGVFASILSLCSCFSSFVLLSWLASLGFLPCLLCCFFGFVGCCFFFPYGCIRIKRKGAKVLPLVSSLVLSWVFRFLYSYYRIPLPLLWLFPIHSVCTPKQYSTRRTACPFSLWFSRA